MKALTPEAVLNLAVERKEQGGLEIVFSSRLKATNFRARCYKEREAVVSTSLKVYQQGDVQFNSSPWDQLCLSIKEGEEGKVSLLIEPEAGPENLGVLEFLDPGTGENLDGE